MSASFRTAHNRTSGDRLEVFTQGEHLAVIITGRGDQLAVTLTPRDAEALALEILDPEGEAKRARAETMLERNATKAGMIRLDNAQVSRKEFRRNVNESMMERNRRALREELARSKAEAEQREARNAEAESIKAEALKIHEVRKRRTAVAAVVAELEDAEHREARKDRKDRK